MKIIQAHLHLSTNLSSRTRDRCPDVVFTAGDDRVATVRTDTHVPKLPLASGSVDELVVHDDALSRVIDEEAWLREFARVISTGGVLRFTLPAEGMMAWLDTMNLYRYIADISKRGDEPNAALPTGWNRHYTRDHIRSLIADAGFAEPKIRSQNTARQEVGMLVGMIRNNWIKRERDAEQQLFPQFGERDPDGRSAILTTTWAVTAQRR